MNYRVYHLSVKEKLWYGFFYMGIALVLCYVFYDDCRFACIGIGCLPFLFRRKEKILAKKRREQLALEFKEFILSFCAALKTGYSVENAVVEAGKDLAYMYGEGADMVNECNKMAVQLKNNKMPEELFSDFAQRSGQDEIKDFAAVFVIAKRSGGNMVAIIRNTANIISEKIEVNREIRLLYAAKKMEQSVMNVVPVAIIGYVRLTTPGYFDKIYHTLFGTIVMTVCLAVYGFAFFLSQKIMDIEV